LGGVVLKPEEFEKFARENPEAARFYQYVERKDGIAYYRLIPYTNYDPTPNMIKMRIALAEAAYRYAYGVKGFEEYKGNVIPKAPAIIGKTLKGIRFKKPDLEKTFKKIERLAKTLAKYYEEKEKRRKVQVLPVET
jgi:hypothetical protein